MSQFKRVDEHITLGPQPTEQDLALAKQQGVKTVIDLRMPAETVNSNAALAKSQGLDYVNIPVNKSALCASQINELEAALEGKEGPFLLHCASGARAAMLLCMNRARKNGWNSKQVFDEARKIGFDIESSPEFSTFVARSLS